MNQQLLQQTRQLSPQDRMQLMEALWDQFSENESDMPLTAVQKRELDRRAADAELHPEKLLSWDEVKSQALARISQ
jgi:putative addiction module component (TIGR02574 family)